MPKLKNRTVSLNDSTKTIITCWHDSLSEAGLIRPRQSKEGDDVSASSFYEYEPTADSNTCNALLFSRLGERQSSSLGESASRFFMSFVNGATGEYSTSSIFAQSVPSSTSVDSVNSEQETRMMPFKMD